MKDLNRSNPLRVLAFIEECLLKYGYQPSYTEIMEHFGWKSKNQVFVCIRWLEAGRYIGPPHGRRRLTILKWADGSPFTGLVR